MRKNYKYLIVILVLSIISLSIGNMHFSWQALLTSDQQIVSLFFNSRLPRLIAVILVGAGLSVSGLIMQKLVQNKFVSPSTAATSDAARFGIMVSLILFPTISTFSRTLFAFVFALAGTILFISMLNRIKYKDIVFVPLLGMMLGLVIDSITTYFALRADVMQVLSGYMLGSFTLLIKGRFELLYLLVFSVMLTYYYAKSFNIAALGSEYAENLGLNYQRIVYLGMAIVSINSAVIISTIGNIAFVGLVIPNLVAWLYGDNLENTLSVTALFGIIFLLAADILSRVVIFPYEIPISLTVGVLGSIMFLILILRRR